LEALMLDKIRIVLVNTSHPGNIGATARAMKNMGLSELYLVEPKYFPDPEADARASGADDILAAARVVSSIDEALADCQLVVGTSARERHIPWPLVNPRELGAISAQMLSSTAGQQGRIALLFGREASGLSNEELQLCHKHVHIPTNPDFSSLNVAAAVQVISYEMRMALVEEQAAEAPQWGTRWDIELADNAEIEQMLEHLERTLVEIDFLDPDNPRQLMPRLRRLIMRAVPDKVEVNVLRGILKKIGRLTQR
jgi:tRNA (cytidine32/uridine32-2'-O)-methyltransferase